MSAYSSHLLGPFLCVIGETECEVVHKKLQYTAKQKVQAQYSTQSAGTIYSLSK